MLETALVIGVITPLFAVQLYNARQISKLKTKVDLIYQNVNIRMDWADRNDQPED